METEKLYYADPFLKDFTATVLSCEAGKDGYLVTLDRTAFYPEGGGQPADHGTMNGLAVTDVHEKNGVIFHTVENSVEIGENVDCTIDWARRFDHMQQHSGEHILSGILCRDYHCDNVGFHMGADTVTIDYNAELTWQQVLAAEEEANRAIWADTPVEITYPSPEELEQLDYRSKKALTGQVRIVTFPGADCCACCGTHVRSSGQVGMIKLLSCQKFREGVRIEMAAGSRALRYCTEVLDQNTHVSQLLSAKPLETASAVERLQKELYSLRGRVAALEEGDFARKAEHFAGKGDVLLIEGDMASESVRRLCAAVMDTCGGRCAVFAGSDSQGYKYAMGQIGGDLRSLVKDLNTALNGRGGGKPHFAQGSLQASAEAIRAFFQNR